MYFRHLIRKLVWECIPRNNFAEKPRNFPGIFSGNPRKFPGIFYWKIWWKCWQLFQGISRNSFRGIRYKKFLLTHSEEILIILSKEFLVTNSGEFLVTNSAENPEKMSTKFVGNYWEFQVKSSSKPIPGNYSQDFLKSSSGISWNIHQQK